MPQEYLPTHCQTAIENQYAKFKLEIERLNEIIKRHVESDELRSKIDDTDLVIRSLEAERDDERCARALAEDKLSKARECLRVYAEGWPGKTGCHADHIAKQIAEIRAEAARKALKETE